MKTLSELADEVVSQMTQEELKKAAKAGVMMTLTLTAKATEALKEAITNGKEEQHPIDPVQR